MNDTEIEQADAVKAPETEIAGPIESKPGEHVQSAAGPSAAQVRLGRATPIRLYAAIGLLALTAVLVIAWRVGLPRGDGMRTVEYIRLTNFPDAVHSPALSRDGKTLLFVRGSEPFQFGPAELYLKVLPDGEPVALTHDGTNKIAPALSPDGSQAVYSTFSSKGWASVSVPIGVDLPRC